MLKIKRLKNRDPLYQPNISIFTKVIFIAGILACLIQVYLGLRYINGDAIERRFGTLSLVEAFFALVGLLFTDIIRGHTFPPRPFAEFHEDTFQRTIIMFLIIVVIQSVIFFVPLTIRDYDMALAMIFAAPAEELFFRGFLMSIFVRVGHDDKNRITIFKKTISYVGFVGIFVSSIAFMMLHVNYYGNFSLMITVFLGGVALSLMYWWWRDLNVVVFAHLALNILVVGQKFFLPTFL